MAYYYNAVAEFNLNHVAKAESAALRAEAADKQHAEPRIQLLLASVYVSEEKYGTAAEHYRAFLKLVPDSPLTERVKTNLAKIEQLAKSQAPANAAISPAIK
jgi:cytochrome c-type biogenesis protein CcmH/NrfG